MMGEELNATDVTHRGLLGDRADALIDRESGKVASEVPSEVDHQSIIECRLWACHTLASRFLPYRSPFLTGA
jgi:hypothetical protein